MKVNFTLYHFKHEGFGLLVYVEQSESESKLKITWTDLQRKITSRSTHTILLFPSFFICLTLDVFDEDMALNKSGRQTSFTNFLKSIVSTDSLTDNRRRIEKVSYT